MKTKKTLVRILSLSFVFVLLFTCFAGLAGLEVSAASTSKYTQSRLQLYKWNGSKMVSYTKNGVSQGIPAGKSVTCCGTKTYKSTSYTLVKYNSSTYYVVTSGLSVFKPVSYVRYPNITKGSINVYKKADLNSEIALTLEADALVNVTGTCGNWSRTVIGGKTYYIQSSKLTTNPTVSSGGVSFVCYDTSLSSQINKTYIRKSLGDYVNAKKGSLSSVFKSFTSAGWSVCITNSNMTTFMSKNGISGTTNSSTDSCGLCIADRKLLVIKTGYFDTAVWHEFGHFVYYNKKLATNGTWKSLYSKYCSTTAKKNDVIKKYGYTTHTTQDANEFFAESFRRYVLGKSLPSDISSFVKKYAV